MQHVSFCLEICMNMMNTVTFTSGGCLAFLNAKSHFMVQFSLINILHAHVPFDDVHVLNNTIE